jgi:hypothetical protein
MSKFVITYVLSQNGNLAHGTCEKAFDTAQAAREEVVRAQPVLERDWTILLTTILCVTPDGQVSKLMG